MSTIAARSDSMAVEIFVRSLARSAGDRTGALAASTILATSAWVAFVNSGPNSLAVEGLTLLKVFMNLKYCLQRDIDKKFRKGPNLTPWMLHFVRY